MKNEKEKRKRFLKMKKRRFLLDPVKSFFRRLAGGWPKAKRKKMKKMRAAGAPPGAKKGKWGRAAGAPPKNFGAAGAENFVWGCVLGDFQGCEYREVFSAQPTYYREA